MIVEKMKDLSAPLDTFGTLTLTNARLILPTEVITGTIHIQDGIITDIAQTPSAISTAIDCDGDYISAGLVELHTDNLERHMEPRPGVKWPKNAAIIAHDSELASVGITTVFDALRVGSIVSDGAAKYGKYAREVADEILHLRANGDLRVSHFIHLRAEVCSETLLEELGEFTPEDRIGIVSIMDHTPGQRQFRDLSKMEEYLVGKYAMSAAAVTKHFDTLYALRDQFGKAHEDGAARIGKSLGAILASHDDTTPADVAASAAKGVKVAEFPTTIEAAKASIDADIAVMMGAPNLLRGHSHSGNVAAKDLAEHGVLTMLSSDYVPASLLMGAVAHGLQSGNMASGLNMVTAAPAKAANLLDRGEITIGKRADLVRFKTTNTRPFTTGVWSKGIRIG